MKTIKQITKELTKELEYRKNLSRGERVYNGLPSNLMNDIYDQLFARSEESIKAPWWPIFSLYLARSCGVVERKYRRKNV